MGQLLSQLLSIFYTKKLDIVVIGLENRYVSEQGEKQQRFQLLRILLTIEQSFGVPFIY
jgi:hypothetical protein